MDRVSYQTVLSQPKSMCDVDWIGTYHQSGDLSKTLSNNTIEMRQEETIHVLIYVMAVYSMTHAVLSDQ